MIKFYIISTFISIFILLINGKTMDSRLIEEGYISHTKYSFIEKLRLSLYMFIPILNILLTFVVLFNYEETYNALKLERVAK